MQRTYWIRLISLMMLGASLAGCGSTALELQPVSRLPDQVAISVLVPPAGVVGFNTGRLSLRTPLERSHVERRLVERLLTLLPESGNIAAAVPLEPNRLAEFVLAVHLRSTQAVESSVTVGEIDYLVVNLGVELQHIPSQQWLMRSYQLELHYDVRRKGIDGLYDFLAEKVAVRVEKQIAQLQELSAGRSTIQAGS